MSDANHGWIISQWSSPRGRGEVTHPAYGQLVFDAAVATVDRFEEGEAVEVELSADGHVVRVSPIAPPAQAPEWQPEVSIKATDLLAFRFASDDERFRFEDFLFDRLGIAAVAYDPGTGFVKGMNELSRALLEGFVGYDIDPFVHIEATYFFDWSSVRPLDAEFAAIWPQLPALHEAWDNAAVFFGTAPSLDEGADALPPPPFILANIEPPGLYVSGVVREADWEAWHAALLHHTRHIPFRRE